MGMESLELSCHNENRLTFANDQGPSESGDERNVQKANFLFLPLLFLLLLLTLLVNQNTTYSWVPNKRPPPPHAY